MSSDPFRIITAIQSGISTIPIIQYETFYRDDFQLNLVENYILKLRHYKNLHQKLIQDYKFLVKKIELSHHGHSSSAGASDKIFSVDSFKQKNLALEQSQ